MASIIFIVLMLAGTGFLVAGLVRSHFHWEPFKAPLFFFVVALLLFGYSRFGQVENWMVRAQLVYTAIVCSIVLVLSSAAALQRTSRS